MAEIARLSDSSDWIDLDFVERERTPERAMKLGIQMHVAGLSLSIPSLFLISWVSSVLGKPFTIGCRRLIYSPRAVQLRIRLRSTRV